MPAAEEKEDEDEEGGKEERTSKREAQRSYRMPAGGLARGRARAQRQAPPSCMPAAEEKEYEDD